MICLIFDDRDTKFHKLHVYVPDIHTINKRLTVQRENHTENYKKPVTDAYISLHVASDREVEIRNMLRKHDHTWSGRLGEINITEMINDLVPDTKPFKSPPYMAGPKTMELEQAEIAKQLKSGVIEPAISKLAAPLLFVPKKDRCVHRYTRRCTIFDNLGRLLRVMADKDMQEIRTENGILMSFRDF